ncbi:MAG: hypothetical protein ACRCZF_04150 [Gemmataceae bacterium]
MRLLGTLWALPITLIGLGLALVAAASGGTVQRRGRVMEAWGGWPARWLRGSRWHSGGAAITLGQVIFARDAACLERSRPHEMVHVQQFEQWGPLLLPMYWLIAASLWCRGRHPYLDHPWEPPPADQVNR